MCTRLVRVARNGLTNISTANSNLDGTGVLSTVLSTGNLSGTQVNSVTIKATGSTSEGMVRLFTYDGSNYFLWKEVYVPENAQTGTVPAFQITINEVVILKASDSLLVSTEIGDSFNIFADAFDWEFCPCGALNSCGESIEIVNTGLTKISTANSKLDGNGTIVTVISSPFISGGEYGTQITFINIKAISSNSEGIVRFFINNGQVNYLIWETPIPGTTQTSVQPAYRTQILAPFVLQPSYSLGASTQNSDTFNVIIFANDISDCPC